MKVADLIDYLDQFDGTEEVVIDDDDFEGTGDYVALRGVLMLEEGDDPPPEQITDAFALNIIQRHLDGQEWEAGDLDRIASIVRATGREIGEP